jgi:tetratricopeptide (TPR) repeat protein
MTDALITTLAQIRSVTVISRASIMRYRGTHKSLPQIGRELHVDAIVEGAVIRAGGRVRIDMQLIETETDRHLWSASYERNVAEVTSVQADIARAVTNEIRVTLTPDEQARLSHAASVDPETHELYMKGRYFWAKRTDDSDRKSIEYFEAAIRRRADYAPAYAAMAEAYTTRNDLPPREVFPRAEAAARAALRIDDTLAEAHTALAACLFYYDWNWAGAREEFERALALDPNSPMAHQWYGQYQKAMRWKNWMLEVQRAEELDPVSPIIAGGGWFIEMGQYDRAIDLLSKKIDLDPNLPFPHLLIGRAYTRKGMFDEAVVHLQKAVELSHGAPEYLSGLGYAYGRAGDRSDAVNTLRELERLSDRRYVSPYNLAIVYAGLGENDLAFARLNDAVAERAIQLVMLNVWGEMDPLRADPRYSALKRRVGLPD